jgi:hypothetical protein
LLYSFPHTSHLGIPQTFQPWNHDELPGLRPATAAWPCSGYVCETQLSSRKQFGNAMAAPWFLLFLNVARARTRLLTEKQAESSLLRTNRDAATVRTDTSPPAPPPTARIGRASGPARCCFGPTTWQVVHAFAPVRVLIWLSSRSRIAIRCRALEVFMRRSSLQIRSGSGDRLGHCCSRVPTGAIGPRDDLEQMTVWILKVDAASAVMVVNLACLGTRRIGPILETPLSHPPKDLVELRFANLKGVVSHRNCCCPCP